MKEELKKRPRWLVQFVLLGLTVVGAVGSTIWVCRDFSTATERMMFWGIVVPWAMVARIPGAFAGEVLGGTSRRAVGWFAGVLAGAAAVLILHSVQNPDTENMLMRLRAGLLPPAIIFGMLAATIGESVLNILEILLSAQSDPEH